MKWLAPYRSLLVLYGIVLAIGIGEFALRQACIVAAEKQPGVTLRG